MRTEEKAGNTRKEGEKVDWGHVAGLLSDVSCPLKARGHEFRSEITGRVWVFSWAGVGAVQGESCIEPIWDCSEVSVTERGTTEVSVYAAI